MNKGRIFNIQKFSVNDGPGIRTTVFLKGCPLTCIWCHNPESISGDKDIFYDSNKCILCGKCETVCKNNCHHIGDKKHLFDRNKCNNCGECANNCIPGALECVGDEKTVQEVLDEVLKDSVFYGDTGGLTLSGGEPMCQIDFIYELLSGIKKYGINTCLETCGYTKEENFRKISKLVDLFLYDYKESDPERHKKFTGVSNQLILNNLKLLNELGSKIVLRCPIIPGYNDRTEHFNEIANIANKVENIIEINIEPFHPLGREKYHMLGKLYKFENIDFPRKTDVEAWIEYIASKTNKPVKKA